MYAKSPTDVEQEPLAPEETIPCVCNFPVSLFTLAHIVDYSSLSYIPGRRGADADSGLRTSVVLTGAPQSLLGAHHDSTCVRHSCSGTSCLH